MVKKTKTINPKKMTPEVRRLYDLAELAGMSPRALAVSYLPVSWRAIYHWFHGHKPQRGQMPALRQAILRLEAVLSPAHWGTQTLGPRAVWVDDDPDTLAKEAAVDKRFEKPLAELMQKATPEEQDLYARNWQGFRELVNGFRKYGVKI